jgi:hypothetical protein
MTSKQKTGWMTLAMYSPLAIYLLAINPWFIPTQHDDVLYYFGARSILESGTFSLGGTPITDWPPLFPLLLAGLMSVLGTSIWVAKFMVFASVAVGIRLIYSVAKAYAFPWPRAIAAITALLPISLINGSTVLSEWPYIVLSMLFLYALHRLAEKRTIRWALAAGGLLAMASLTRFVGVLLGAAILLQAWKFMREKGPRAVLPELLASLIGGSIWVAWKIRSSLLIENGLAPSGVYDRPDYYLHRFGQISLFDLLSKIESVLFSFGKVFESVLHVSWLAIPLAIAIGAAILWGLIIRVKKRGFSGVEAYVGITLLLLFGDESKPERYFATLAPFLIGYLFIAAQSIVAAQSKPQSSHLLQIGLVGWICVLLALDGYLLFVGNNDKTRGGFSMLVNRDIESYYRGEPLDLYRALRWTDENSEKGAIAAAGFHGKYVLAFTGRAYRTLPNERADDTIALVGFEEDIPEGWKSHRQFGRFHICERTEPAP